MTIIIIDLLAFTACVIFGVTDVATADLLNACLASIGAGIWLLNAANDIQHLRESW